MYPSSWHQLYGDKTGHSARQILPNLLSLFAVRTTIEIGCGNGHWTQVAIDNGVIDYLVVDGPWNHRDDLLVDPAKFVEADLSKPFKQAKRFDVAICLEVAEHVATQSSITLVETLVNLADVVLFGAAIPGQGGHGHINEQWPSWWRDRFAQFDYQAFDLVRPLHWNDQSIHYWYRQNMFVYVSAKASQLIAAAQQAAAEHSRADQLFDAVLPERFASVSSYESIDAKKLTRRLPGWLAMRLRQKMGI